MDKLYARSVFFVRDAERSLRFYTGVLGCAVDWKYEDDGRPFVFQVSLLGFELILNQTGSSTADRAGHGRLFIGLDDDQSVAFRRHVQEKAIETSTVDWGQPTMVIRDVDGNELFFWLSDSDQERRI